MLTHHEAVGTVKKEKLAARLRGGGGVLFAAGKPSLQQAPRDALTESGFAGASGVPAALSPALGVAGARIIYGEMGL